MNGAPNQDERMHVFAAQEQRATSGSKNTTRPAMPSGLQLGESIRDGNVRAHALLEELRRIRDELVGGPTIHGSAFPHGEKAPKPAAMLPVLASTAADTAFTLALAGNELVELAKAFGIDNDKIKAQLVEA